MKSVKLQVGELTGRGDFGRGIAKLDTRTMNDIGVNLGDIIEITGGKRTVAVAVNCYPADIGMNIIRIDGLVRKNAGISIGETVTIKKSIVKNAKKVVFEPAEKNLMLRMLPDSLKQNVFKRPFMQGDMIIASPVFRERDSELNLFGGMLKGTGLDTVFDEVFIGGGETRLKVVKTIPKAPVQITDKTNVEILPCSSKTDKDFLFDSRSKMPVPLSVTMEWKGSKQKFMRVSKSFTREGINKYLAKHAKKRDELFCFHSNGKWFVFRRVDANLGIVCSPISKTTQ